MRISSETSETLALGGFEAINFVMYKILYKTVVLVFKNEFYTVYGGLEMNCDTNIHVLYNRETLT